MLLPVKSRRRTGRLAGSLLTILAVVIVSSSTILVGSAQSTAVPVSSEASHAVDLSQPLTLSWRHESNLTLNLTPAFADQRVYLPLSGGTIVSLIASTGELNWRSDM